MNGMPSLRCLVGLVLLLWTGVAAAAAPATVAVIYGGGESTGPVELQRAANRLGEAIDLTVYAPGPGGRALTPESTLGAYDLVFVDAALDGYDDIANHIDAALRTTRVAVVNAASADAGNVPLAAHPDLQRYWDNPSQYNYEGLFRYLLSAIIERPLQVSPPRIYGDHSFYHPDAEAPFDRLEDYLEWLSQRLGPVSADTLTLGLRFHHTQMAQRDTAHIDALIRATEARGHRMLALATKAGTDLSKHLVRDGAAVVDALLFHGQRIDFQDREAGIAQARALGVPILSAIAHRSLDAEGYAASLNGLAPEMSGDIVNNEREGMIEPMVIGARGPSREGRRFVDPMPAQIEWRVDRALSWARLRRMDNADKRVAITYWSESGGKADLGGDPDDFLDVPASLLRLLEQMRARGYDVGEAPLPERDELIRRMVDEASNIGNWAPAELASRVANADVALIPEAVYLQWFEALPSQRREEIEALWGPAPGDIMAHRDRDGRRYLVIPRIRFGNVLIAPHPEWGYLQNEAAMMSRTATPPHHQYLAFYLWMRHEWRADAWISAFSNIVLQPGKSQGPLLEEHVGQLLGDLPHIHPERLGSNGGISNKRKAMAHTPGWYNIVTAAGELEALQELNALLRRHDALADPQQRADAESEIRAMVAGLGLDRALGTSLMEADAEQWGPALRLYLRELAQTTMPHGTKILGDGPEGDALVVMVTGMLGAPFRAALEGHRDTPREIAQALVRSVLIDGRSPAAAVRAQLDSEDAQLIALLAEAPEFAARLHAAPRETLAILEALEGQWLEPGPIDEPMRRPDAVPPGRALYHFDQAAIPTPEAERAGRRQASAMIETYREEHGGEPRQFAFVLWSSDTTRNHGITEAQILDLLGTRPRRNVRGEVVGAELIPRETLGRPRIDVLVTASGTYRDHFPANMELIAEAVRLAAESDEPDNPVFAASEEARHAFLAAGMTPDQAEKMALARVFSEAPGAYSPNIQFLAQSGDRRGDEARMATLYLDRVSHAYGGGHAGESQRAAFENQVRRLDAAVLPRSSSVNAMLDQPMSAGYLGGLNLAARHLTGADISLYVSDLREGEAAGIQSASRFLQAELRTRYFNPQWIRQMQAHGYDGARNFMFMTDHLDLWNSTARQMVSSEDWAEVKSVYVDDHFDLDIDAFFDQHNPYAQQALLGNLLGAAQRGHWDATEAELAQIAERLVRSTLAHGPSCHANQCANTAMTEFISASLAPLPDAAPLVAAYEAALAETAGGGGAPGPEVVTGRVMTQVAPASAPATPTMPIQLWLLLLAFALLAWGWWRGDLRQSSPSARGGR